jgi:hypothetical protein
MSAEDRGVTSSEFETDDPVGCWPRAISHGETGGISPDFTVAIWVGVATDVRIPFGPAFLCLAVGRLSQEGSAEFNLEPAQVSNKLPRCSCCVGAFESDRAWGVW